MAEKELELPWHARMWPREIFDTPSSRGRRGRKLADDLDILQKSGVYILYRDDIPYYVGQATTLLTRLAAHHKPGARYALFWNYFSVFVLEDPDEINKIEAILITAFPTVNGATPRIKRQPYPPEVTRLVRQMSVRRIGVRLDEGEAVEE
jgi:hypothetical protein